VELPDTQGLHHSPTVLLANVGDFVSLPSVLSAITSDIQNTQTMETKKKPYHRCLVKVIPNDMYQTEKFFNFQSGGRLISYGELATIVA
jgi:hypothetical protein